jgi:hypothetical protein
MQGAGYVLTGIVECNTERAADVMVWLEKAMIEGTSAIISDMGKAHVPVEVAAQIARSWGDRR